MRFITRLTLGVMLPLALLGCGDTGAEVSSVEQSGTVEAEATPEATPAGGEAQVEIVEQGFTQKGDQVYVGVVVENVGDAGAGGVSVEVNALDQAGDAVVSDAAEVNVIPAGEKVNVGMQLMAEGEKVRDIEVFADATDTGLDPGIGLPDVTRARVKQDQNEYFPSTSITAQVHNTLDAPLSGIADVWAVLYDRSGEVIGGVQTFPTNDVQPGRRTSVEFPIGEYLPEVAKVEVTADNEITD